ncbi:MAG: hypothetical protein AAB509_00230 [Patescibacteria group bacterium]
MKYNDITLGQVEAVWNKLGGMEGVERFLRGEVTFKQPALLRKLASVQVDAVVRLVADEKTRKDANVGWTGDNFKKFFLGNVEEDVEAIIVAVHRLGQSSLDAPIMTELGDRAKIKIAHFFELLKKQSRGEDGVLLTNGYANVAYIKGSDGNVWAVRAYWGSYSSYWSVEANSVGSPSMWVAGVQILSRDS